MCVSAHPASFSKTVAGVFETTIQGEPRHVVYYQNTVGAASTGNRPALAIDKLVMRNVPANPFGQPSPATRLPPAHWSFEEKPQGNCLIIPLPGEWRGLELVDTTKAKNALKDITKALEGEALSFSKSASRAGEAVHVDFDVYRVVIAERPGLIAAELEKVPALKRPAVNKQIFDAFDEWYACPMAVACFNVTDAKRAAPMAFSFKPLFPEYLSVYMLDGHDGNVPDLGAQVERDHTVFVSSLGMVRGEDVEYTDRIPPEVKQYLPQRVIGRPVRGPTRNGDLIFRAADVRAGKFKGKLVEPPNAPVVQGRQPEFIEMY